MADANAIHRAKDVSFALTQALAAPELAGRLDANRIVAAGHSYGANTTMLLAGARVERGGQTLQFKDPRIKAAVIISAPPFYGDADLQKILQQVDVPTLHVTGNKDTITVPGYHSDPQDRIKVYEAMPAAKALVLFDGATHSIFTDRVDRSGSELNLKVKAATREVTRRFFEDVLAMGQPGESVEPPRAAPNKGLRRVNAWLDDNASLLVRP